MWHAMFVGQISLGEKILRTVLVYALIALLFRAAGKRGLASLNTFDFVVIFLLSNVVQNAQVQRGSLEPGGQLVLTRFRAEQSATKADIAEVTARLSRIEELPGAAR
jgi:uncharacterized membrane protein YcaP (DUF421 family)